MFGWWESGEERKKERNKTNFGSWNLGVGNNDGKKGVFVQIAIFFNLANQLLIAILTFQAKVRVMLGILSFLPSNGFHFHGIFSVK